MVDHDTPMKCFVSKDRRNRKPKQSNANASFVKPAQNLLDQRCETEFDASCCHQSLIYASYIIDC